MNILITGGAKGIGKETALRLVERGHNVKVIDNDSEALKGLDADIQVFEGDVREKEDIEKATRHFEVEVLINSAGIQRQGAVEDLSLDDFRDHMENNFMGTVTCVKTCMNSIRRSNGRIINISSIAGKTGAPFLSGYCASKYAVEGFSDSLRMELNNSDIDVVLVEPGPIKTGFNRRGRDHLRKFVPGSRYSSEYSKKLGEKVEGAETEKAAAKVVESVESENPKTRYTVTWDAFFVRKFKRFVPDRLWDRALLYLRG